MSKSIFLSKVFWANILGVAAMVGNVLPPKYGVPAMGIVNVLLRLVTDQATHIIPPVGQ